MANHIGSDFSYQLPRSEYCFLPSGGKSAAQPTRKGHTALGDIGEWVVGSLRSLRLAGTFPRNAAAAANDVAALRRNPFKTCSLLHVNEPTRCSSPQLTWVGVQFRTCRSSAVLDCIDRAKVEGSKARVLCRLGEAGKGLLRQLGKIVPLRNSSPGAHFSHANSRTTEGVGRSESGEPKGQVSQQSEAKQPNKPAKQTGRNGSVQRDDIAGFGRAKRSHQPDFSGSSPSCPSRFKYRYKLVRPIPKVCAARWRLP
jgi:hypothetical protein